MAYINCLKVLATFEESSQRVINSLEKSEGLPLSTGKRS